MNKYFDDIELLKPPIVRAAYSDRMAWIMAECSALAYENESALKQGLADGGFRLRKIFEKDNFSAYLAAREEFAVLAFCGTVINYWSNILADVDFPLIRIKNKMVDRGFYQAFMALSDDIQAELQKLRQEHPGKPFPIYLTGHSLGGAMALLATFELPYSDDFAACYTFGAPRVGNRKTALECHQIPVYRSMHEVDLVPALPLAIMGYTQIGDVRFLSDRNEVSSGSLAVFSRIFGMWRFWKWLHLISDHGIANYARILKTFAEEKNPPEQSEPKRTAI